MLLLFFILRINGHAKVVMTPNVLLLVNFLVTIIKRASTYHKMLISFPIFSHKFKSFVILVIYEKAKQLPSARQSVHE